MAKFSIQVEYINFEGIYILVHTYRRIYKNSRKYFTKGGSF